VFRTLTTSKGWDSWFTTGAIVEPVIGGRMYLAWEQWGAERISGADPGIVKAVQENELFSFLWHPQGDDNPTTVTITLEPDGDGTLLKLTDEGYLDTPEGREAQLYCATGWGEALTLLKVFLETGYVYR
jgi:uncharacterized protein YndB with AHSA1/START domain